MSVGTDSQTVADGTDHDGFTSITKKKQSQSQTKK